MQGSAQITSVNDTMLAVIVTPTNDKTLRHIFQIGFDRTVPATNAILRSVSVEFRGSELVLMSGDDQIFYRFSVRDQASAEVRAPRGFNTVDYVGIGLSHLVRHASASNDTARCNDCDVTYIDPDGWNATGSTSCSQGGVGSTSCSLEVLGFSCSVSCATGYYACCNANSGCKCVKG